MPIAFVCPHCQKSFSVADQYAGQTGPCAGCGKTMTVPASPFAPLPSAAKAGGGGAAIIVVAVVLVLLVCPGILIALLLPAVQAAREAARRTQSMNNVKQIVLALHNYHDQYGSFPPAVVTDATGKPLYSGRVLLLPYLEQASIYNMFAKDEPWDSPTNLPISQMVIPTFVDPSAPTPRLPGQTDYVFVTGQGTIFEGDKASNIASVTDGTSNTMLIVEAKSIGGSWAEPKDLDLSQPMALPPGNHPGINLVGLADGSVRSFSKVNPTIIRSLATKSGNEAIQSP